MKHTFTMIIQKGYWCKVLRIIRRILLLLLILILLALRLLLLLLVLFLLLLLPLFTTFTTFASYITTTTRRTRSTLEWAGGRGYKHYRDSPFRGSGVMRKKRLGQNKNLHHHHLYMLHAGSAGRFSKWNISEIGMGSKGFVPAGVEGGSSGSSGVLVIKLRSDEHTFFWHWQFKGLGTWAPWRSGIL